MAQSNQTNLLERLQEPFKNEDIEWRIQQAGQPKTTEAGKWGWALVLVYVTNRAIMERLDEVMGVENWRNEFKDAPGSQSGVLCGLSLRINDEWVTKWDGADKTDIEAVKGGLSNAMKRAAVQWGIGRYLYKLESIFVNLYTEKGNHTFNHYDKESKTRSYWSAPNLPEWALPEDKEQTKKNAEALKGTEQMA